MVKPSRGPRIGLLALQGDFALHTSMLRSLGAMVREVRLPSELETLDALIIPGGESTTITKLLTDELRDALLRFAERHPVWGTCAGMIMLCRDFSDPRITPLGLVDADLTRMGFGRQVFSFESDLRLSEEIENHDTPFHGIFIRAPRVAEHDSTVRGIAWLNDEPVALRQGNFLLTSFHPELTNDTRFHELFLSMIG